MAHHLCQLPCRRPVYVFDHVEVRREEYVKVSLVDLLSLEKLLEKERGTYKWGRNSNWPPHITRLHNRRI